MPQYEDMQLSQGCMIGSNASSRTKLPYQCKYLCSCSYISVVHAHHLTAIVYEIAVPIFQSPQHSRFGLVLTEISSAEWVTTFKHVGFHSGRCGCFFFIWNDTISTFTIFVEYQVLSRKLGVPLWVDFMN